MTKPTAKPRRSAARPVARKQMDELRASVMNELSAFEDEKFARKAAPALRSTAADPAEGVVSPPSAPVAAGVFLGRSKNGAPAARAAASSQLFQNVLLPQEKRITRKTREWVFKGFVIVALLAVIALLVWNRSPQQTAPERTVADAVTALKNRDSAQFNAAVNVPRLAENVINTVYESGAEGTRLNARFTQFIRPNLVNELTQAVQDYMAGAPLNAPDAPPTMLAGLWADLSGGSAWELAQVVPLYTTDNEALVEARFHTLSGTETAPTLQVMLVPVRDA